MPRSIPKLELARDRALPVWLRFGGGGTAAIAGVHVVDLMHTPAAV